MPFLREKTKHSQLSLSVHTGAVPALSPRGLPAASGASRCGGPEFLPGRSTHKASELGAVYCFICFRIFFNNKFSLIYFKKSKIDAYLENFADKDKGSTKVKLLQPALISGPSWPARSIPRVDTIQLVVCYLVCHQTVFCIVVGLGIAQRWNAV